MAEAPAADAPADPTASNVSGRRHSASSGSTLSATDGVLQIGGSTMRDTQKGTDGKQLPDTTLTGLFLSGKLTNMVHKDVLATVPEAGMEEGDAFDDIIPLEYFPDPPCVMPPDEEPEDVLDHGITRKSVPDYWKEHAHPFDTWPQAKRMREIHQEFVRVLGGGRARTSSITNSRLFVNITPGQIGVRESPNFAEHAKTGEVVEPGQVVSVVDYKDEDGARWWRLKHMNGWIFETKDGQRVMQEAMNVECGMWWYRLACKECIEVRTAPGYGNEVRSGWVVSPGELVVCILRCRIGPSQYLLLKDGRGWVFTWKPVLCDSGYLRAGHDVAMEECNTDFLESGATQDFRRAIPPTDNIVEVGSWTYVVQKRPVLCVGSKQHGTFLSPGDIIRVDKRCAANGAMHRGIALQERVWVRLLDGRGWVPVHSDDGQEQLMEQDPTDLTYPAWFGGNQDLDAPDREWMTGFC